MVKCFQSNNILSIENKINTFLKENDFYLIEYKYLTTLPNGEMIIMIQYAEKEKS
jgi:hypothetical protein